MNIFAIEVELPTSVSVADRVTHCSEQHRGDVPIHHCGPAGVSLFFALVLHSVYLIILVLIKYQKLIRLQV